MTNFSEIQKALKEKVALKQAIYRNTIDVFNNFRTEAKKLIDELQANRGDLDENVHLEYKDKGTFEFEMKFGGDMLIFVMHTNVFGFDKSHSVWQTDYVKEDVSRSYCGMINIYNFLSDTFKYNRQNDVGYMIGRILINKDDHFFMEGKRKLNFLYNKFDEECCLNEEIISDIIQTSILYSMNFDLITPPYQEVHEMSAGELIRNTSFMQLKTGKRLGYKFSFESDDEIT